MTAGAALRMPDAKTVFARRAARFGRLAESAGALAAYLLFLQRVSEAQHAALESLAYGVDELHRSWREPLSAMADHLSRDGTPQMLDALGRALRAPDGEADGWAEALARGEQDAVPVALIPLVGGALQVQRHAFASALGGEAARNAFVSAQQSPLCPVCGAVPLASVIRTDGEVTGLRYLHCTLCGTEWNYVRITCAACGTTKGLAYYCEEGREYVKAEACEPCRGYVKMFSMEHDPDVDPVADDVASIELDVLMGESGLRRMAPNPLFAFG
ncbi:MAG TPA: formate dehydrogenase accessory protein FdhE [Candidatus Dormibacteraeota bacterium]|nr:formate dehydrogenase accessory protein FdhE [Candidatus Dormibacteraeota bacterium]